MAKIEVDYAKCLALARHIELLGGVPPDREDPMPYTFPASVAENGWCATVAINHQTTPVVGTPLRGTVRGKFLRGWDYLLQKSILEANRNSEMYTVAWFLSVTPAMLCDIFRDENEGETLTGVEGRAEILNSLGRFLRENNWNGVRGAYLVSDGYIMRNDGLGLAQLFSRTCGYADPVQKKLFYFLALMHNQGFWEYRDIFNLSSPVNYHEQRGHFRLGTVKILDAELERKILNRENIDAEEDVEIRFAVRHAIEFVAGALNVAPSAMHYFFWNYFRNCCGRDAAHCASCGDNCRLPERYRPQNTAACILAPACKSAGIHISEMLIEPRLDDTIWQ